MRDFEIPDARWYHPCINGRPLKALRAFEIHDTQIIQTRRLDQPDEDGPPYLWLTVTSEGTVDQHTIPNAITGHPLAHLGVPQTAVLALLDPDETSQTIFHDALHRGVIAMHLRHRRDVNPARNFCASTVYRLLARSSEVQLHGTVAFFGAWDGATGTYRGLTPGQVRLVLQLVKKALTYRDDHWRPAPPPFDSHDRATDGPQRHQTAAPPPSPFARPLWNRILSWVVGRRSTHVRTPRHRTA